MNKKVAKLATVSFMTRVVVNENATNEEILNAARPKFAEKVATELGENLEEIVDDEECPFGVLLGDFYPAYIESIVVKYNEEFHENSGGNPRSLDESEVDDFIAWAEKNGFGNFSVVFNKL